MERVHKLGQIKGDRASEAFADLIAPISSLAEDPAAVDLFMGDGPTTRLGRAAGMIKVVAKHKAEIMAIEAVKRGIPVEEFEGKLSMETMFTSCSELLNDSMFLCFFILAHRDLTEQSASTSAPEPTEAPEA